MGVDIYGKSPKLTGKRPEFNYDDENTTDEQKDEFWRALEKWEKNNPGYYFRSNWWGWRPIVQICKHAAEQFELDFDLDWNHNDGKGLDNWQECNALADALEKVIAQEENLIDDEDVIYCNMGDWSARGNKGMLDASIAMMLNRDYPYGTIMFSGIVGDGGAIYEPTHSTPLWLVKEFIIFLKNCGGFSVW